MAFHRGYSGGNCISCTWIAAQGVITADIPAAFQTFLDEQALTNLSGVNIHLNSPGGNLGAALALGRMIRASGAGTVVAETAGVRTDYGLHDLFLETDKPACLSACVFAFIGGETRVARSDTIGQMRGYQTHGPLGVHQFYGPDAGPATVDPTVRVADQGRTALLLEYVAEMGVSAELLVLGLKTGPRDMRLLTDDEVTDLRIDTGAQAAQARLTGYANGVGVVEITHRSRQARYRHEFFCDRAGVLHLKMQVTWDGTNWGSEQEGNLAHFFQTLTTVNFGSLRYQSGAHTRQPDGLMQSIVQFTLPDSQSGTLAQRDEFWFQNATSSWFSQVADGFNFRLSQPHDGFHLLPKLCLP
ncbi:hypothetical protein [Antarctobacter sp.]|uniref:COG3904 family protein n=1 Tax=Antarctobacter sp. TaxID=1872577 RepID=UPI002B2708F8|nr:hypothetical protein [Antarctobacter sp.]